MTPEFIRAANDVWSSIAVDAYEMCDGENEVAWEFVLDANRLTTFGHPEAEEELKQTLKRVTFQSLIKTLAREYPLL